MSLHMLTPAELAKVFEFNFRLIEPGFIIRAPGKGFTEPEQYYLAREKDEATKTLQAVHLSLENTLSLLAGVVPASVTLEKTQLLNVYPTAVTEAMCREREGLTSRCVDCKLGVYQWHKGQPDGVQNYRVDAEGFCHHLDCNDATKKMPIV